MEEDGARRGGHPGLGPDGGGRDLISALPEDLLLQVLRRLGCARAAARTSLLSRHWRGLWRRIAEFTFRDVALRSLLPALDSLLLADVFLLDIRLPEVTLELSPGREEHFVRISSLLRAAAGLSPVELRLRVPPCFPPRQLTPNVLSHSLTVHLPCFLHATSIDLLGLDLLFDESLASGSGYMFPMLETLSLFACRVDVHALVLQCPRLRVLRAIGCLHGDEDFTVRPATLQELVVQSKVDWTGRIDFEVPALNRLVLNVFVERELRVSVSAPVVEKVSWMCSYSRAPAAGIGLWGLATLRLQTESNALFLLMGCLDSYSFPHTELILAQEIQKQLVVTDFSVLNLRFLTTGHAFGAFLFCLLRIHWIRTAIKCLTIDLQDVQEEETCLANCPCDEPKSWRSQTISLNNLEEVEIKVLRGDNHEFATLLLIFRCAPMLKRMTVRLSDEVKTTSNWRKEMYDIFKAYPLVECFVRFG
ncbi:unnamed protein product [Alopecurus aequalis]